MPALVNYGGDDEFFTKRGMELGRFYSMDPHVDVYHSPGKRSRIYAPDALGEYAAGRKKQVSLEVLPDECLLEIFGRLASGRERSACACVSKRWLFLLSSMRKSDFHKCLVAVKDDDDETSFHVSKEMLPSEEEEGEGYLSRCLEGKKATDVKLAAIAAGTSHRGGLGKLSIRGSNPIRGITNLGLSSIGRGCPSLRSLSLWSISSIGDEGLVDIAKGCKYLEKLDLCDCPDISDKGLIAIAEHCPMLTSVNLESCLRIGNEGLGAVGRLCLRLQSISIKDCPLVGDRGIASLVSSPLSVLNRIKLQSLNITDFSLAVIGHYGQRVSNLFLGGLKNTTEKGFWAMGNTRGLKRASSLTVVSCRGVTDFGLEAIGRGCIGLKQICLRKCCSVSDNGLVALARNATSLEIMQLDELSGITLAGVAGVISSCRKKMRSLSLVNCNGVKDFTGGAPVLPISCTSLRSLSVRNCSGFGNAGLTMVGSLCPSLQHLDLAGLCGITDAGLLPLLEKCEGGLVKVNLSGCFNVTDKAVSALVRLNGGTLEVLNLDGCRKVTDESLVAISDNCFVLNDLDLSKCAITDSGIAALSEATQPNLQILSLSDCSKVTDKSVPFLGCLARSLLGLNLQHCHSISNGAVESLMEISWRCDIISSRK